MNAETIFSTVNLTAVIGWSLLVVAPRWNWTLRIVISGAIPLLLSVAYLTLIVLFFDKADGGFDSLESVMKLFTNQWMVLVGWIHYLAFDLFVGSWETKDAQARGVSHWLVVPCLILTLFFGPVGFFLYNVIRLFYAKSD
jgi:hypothetical protein